MPIQTFPHPPRAATTEEQHTDPMPGPAHPTKEATAQQVGRKCKITVLTAPYYFFPLMFSLCLSNIRRIVSTFLWNPDRMGDMLFAQTKSQK